MRAIEIARKLDALGRTEDACQAYYLAIQQSGGQAPEEEMEAAVYILQSGGNYKISYTCFCDLYNRGYFCDDILSLMTEAFYKPNVRMLKSRYEKNCRLLSRYPYLFRKDFLSFEELPVRFFPFDDAAYVPFYLQEKRFGDYINFKHPVVSRNFFKDLENPILADDVYSQYELEYLNDNVRPSEYVGRENHVYLHYTDWGEFCAHLACLSLRPVLLPQKVIFLIEDEISLYPIDFKERFGIDYSRCAFRPVGIREVNKMIWHTQLSTHNGGDFFNEIFDGHPNLLCMPSMMMDNIEGNLTSVRKRLDEITDLRELLLSFDNKDFPSYLMEEIFRLRDRTDKDLLVLLYLSGSVTSSKFVDQAARIVPAVFFQPHFKNIVYELKVGAGNQVVLAAENYEKLRQSPLFRNFKYIKTFTPMRRPTTSHGATVKFMYQMALESLKALETDKTGTIGVVSDALTERVLNRSFMIDWQDRLFQDSRLVRFEDGKLNPKATFTALAAFLDLPYTESMTYCSLFGERDPEGLAGNVRGFDLDTVYRTYDDYINDDERYFIEFFLRDAYAFYGYGFQYYDGKPVDEEKIATLVEGFTTVDHYIRETWRNYYRRATVSRNGEQIFGEQAEEFQDQVLEEHMEAFKRNRMENAKVLMERLEFINKNGQPLHMMPKLELDPALLERPLYH